jgi:hypothetical protein
MKKKSKKVEPSSIRRTSYTEDELEQMAIDLVNRGLSSKAILTREITKSTWKDSRPNTYIAFERS